MKNYIFLMDEDTKRKLKSAGKLTGLFFGLGLASYGWVKLAEKIRDELEDEVLHLKRT